MSVQAVRSYLAEPQLLQWYEQPDKLAALWRWLDYRGMAPDDPAYFMEEPWKWQREWDEMVAHGGAS